ncbi:MAG: type IV toxin-antitoxin system AbiEi family antitoxin domain-containing protein [Streptosporangiales bacterium]
MRTLPAELDALIARQCGLVSRSQLLSHGITGGTARTRVEAGRWRRTYPGVYATITGRLSREGEIWAALLYAGEGATVSHQTAAELHGLVDDADAEVDVMVPVGRRVRSRRRVRVHYAHRLPQTRNKVRVPPVVGIDDTVLDLVDASAHPREAVDWVSRAVQRRRTTAGRLRSALESRKKIRWRDAVSGVLADVSTGAETPLELAYLRLVERAHGLPTGTRQRHRKVGRATQWIDVDYEEYAVRVELDGRLGHTGDGAFRDRARDNVSSEEGYVTLRYGWTETRFDACATAVQVSKLLQRHGWAGAPVPCGPDCPLLSTR